MCETSANVDKTNEVLPQSFNVKYLGHRESKGLWGIKNTRRPVDAMILHAKQSASSLVLMRIDVTKDGCIFTYNNKTKVHPIDTISYGVQDLVYTRVFSMIIVRDISDVRIEQHPFECHAFMCESKQAARQLTYCLAAAFQDYSKRVKATNNAQQKFAIDLRSPEEIQADLKVDSEA